jgi:hypothetical protein
LTKLRLVNCGITDEGGRLLAAALSGSRLALLDLQRNNLTSGLREQMVREFGDRVLI